jgi:hypothetical protein
LDEIHVRDLILSSIGPVGHRNGKCGLDESLNEIRRNINLEKCQLGSRSKKQGKEKDSSPQYDILLDTLQCHWESRSVDQNQKQEHVRLATRSPPSDTNGQ